MNMNMNLHWVKPLAFWYRIWSYVESTLGLLSVKTTHFNTLTLGHILTIQKYIQKGVTNNILMNLSF